MGMRLPLRQEILNQTLAAIRLLRPFVEQIARRDRELASQIRRAMSSVGLNVGEAFGSHCGNSRLRFQTALGSIRETEGGIGVAIAWGYISETEVAPTLAALDRLSSRIFGLSRH
jgi:four helix bundle protein